MSEQKPGGILGDYPLVSVTGDKVAGYTKEQAERVRAILEFRAAQKTLGARCHPLTSTFH